jgi:hypothetical protein
MGYSIDWRPMTRAGSLFSLRKLHENRSSEEDTMSVVYKIHPAIGVARIGDHPTDFFLGPELLNGLAIEINPDGSEQPLINHKSNGRIKRQGARFRIFAYDKAADGSLSNPREITASEAAISWTVELANRKAAWDQVVDTQDATPPRNRNVDSAARSTLIVAPGARSISGRNASGQAFDNGRFVGQTVFLGELRTDAAGRLIVLGGRGAAFALKPDQPVGDLFADNDGWCDDVSDGPVRATVTIGDVSTPVEGSARVIVAPADFAPNVGGAVTLYDVAQQVAIDSFGAVAPQTPSFKNDIQPILARCASLRWTNRQPIWAQVPESWDALSNATDAAANQLRQQVAALLSGPLPLHNMSERAGDNLQLTKLQKSFLASWAVGNFRRDWGQPNAALTPSDYDRGPLEGTVGGGFFPGIEAGSRMKDGANYKEPFRLKDELPPGFLTEQMAVPWHSDFYFCLGRWWPAQRPDVAFQRNKLGGLPPDWTKGIIRESGQRADAVRDMISRFSKLGYIKKTTINGKDVQVEDERDPAFPR